MKILIIKELAEIEKIHNIRILLAVESGSRAWGFESPDSDYDIRFIYIRPMSEYLKLKPNRDVIEKPMNNLLDINGWDLNKTLQLIYKSNPTLFEWFSSPILYKDSDVANDIRMILNQYFNKKHCLYHYLSMASGNYRHYLKSERVRAKKYFYTLRPILACRWILNKGTPPPIRFQELARAELPNNLSEEVEMLLNLKMTSQETKEIDRIDKIHYFLETSIEEISRIAAGLPNSPSSGWEELDRIFLKELERSKF